MGARCSQTWQGNKRAMEQKRRYIFTSSTLQRSARNTSKAACGSNTDSDNAQEEEGTGGTIGGRNGASIISATCTLRPFPPSPGG